MRLPRYRAGTSLMIVREEHRPDQEVLSGHQLASPSITTGGQRPSGVDA